jgi:hypothetical protein
MHPITGQLGFSASKKACASVRQFHFHCLFLPFFQSNPIQSFCKQQKFTYTLSPHIEYKNREIKV